MWEGSQYVGVAFTQDGLHVGEAHKSGCTLYRGTLLILIFDFLIFIQGKTFSYTVLQCTLLK